MPVIEDKRWEHLQDINLPNSKDLQALKDAIKKVQQTAWRCANECLMQNLLQILEMLVECATVSRKLYDQSREWLILLTEKNEQIERWVEQYLNI